MKTLRELKRERAGLWRKFQRAGGRGVDLAEAIDELDAEIARLEGRDPDERGADDEESVYDCGGVEGGCDVCLALYGSDDE